LTPVTSYLICCVPRTGSWLLAEALQSTAIAGKPREYFAPEHKNRFYGLWGLSPSTDYADFLSQVKLEATTPNGVCGAKAHWYQFHDLVSKLWALPELCDLPVRELLPRVFPNLRYIYLTRRDRIRHVVSYARASDTRIWWDMDPSAGPGRRVLAKTPKFDPQKLDRLFHSFAVHQRGWRRYFEECGVTPLELSYEDFAEDQTASVRRILDYLEIPFAPDLVVERPRLRKQADALSEIWARRYRQIRLERRLMSCQRR